ncbi:MAG: bacteriohemerythrin [Flavobacterium sp.]|nr:bacteriohemerythrin [Flavobacterium sp.]
MDNEFKVPKWNNKFLIGVPDVDLQHQYFLKLIIRLEKRFNVGMDSHLTYRHFNEILKYADFHFQSEENLMLLYNYPEFDLHHKLHIELLDEVGTSLNYYNLGRKDASEIIEMLVNWFLNHTIEVDAKFGNFVKKLNLPIDD